VEFDILLLLSLEAFFCDRSVVEPAGKLGEGEAAIRAGDNGAGVVGAVADDGNGGSREDRAGGIRDRPTGKADPMPAWTVATARIV